MTLLESLSLPMGTPASDFSLKGTDGRTYTLADFSDAKALVICFICNHCPYVQAIWPRLVALQERFKDRRIRFVGINPNIANPDYDEETLEMMGKYAGRYKMNFPYLADETQEVAKTYKAQCTPDIYVFDHGEAMLRHSYQTDATEGSNHKDRKLAYHGRIDDNWQNPEAVTKQELAEALEALLKGEDPSGYQNPTMGCSIKWVD